jgi:hypothetical protein
VGLCLGARALGVAALQDGSVRLAVTLGDLRDHLVASRLLTAFDGLLRTFPRLAAPKLSKGSGFGSDWQYAALHPTASSFLRHPGPSWFVGRSTTNRILLLPSDRGGERNGEFQTGDAKIDRVSFSVALLAPTETTVIISQCTFIVSTLARQV